jgi:hypothetical protein
LAPRASIAGSATLPFDVVAAEADLGVKAAIRPSLSLVPHASDATASETTNQREQFAVVWDALTVRVMITEHS